MGLKQASARSYCARLAATLAPAIASHAAVAAGAETPDAAIVRYAPTRARTLPIAYVKDLSRRGCSIPQSVFVQGPQADIDNVITGSFARRGQVDHAVLCSIDGVSHIDVHWGGNARYASTLEAAADGVADGERNGEPARGYDRGIDRASQKRIALYRDALGGPEAPDRSHDGIEDSSEKTSTIWYCAKGTWIPLQGMD